MDKNLYTRPNKPKRITVKDRSHVENIGQIETTKPIEISARTECYVTPPDVARQMIDYLEATSDMMTLEPSAGTGNLIEALVNDGHSFCEMLAIELCVEVHSALRQRIGSELVSMNRCFLEYAEEAENKVYFPRIVMNPPFKKIKKHMNTALSLLGRNGHKDAILVALVPITYEHEDMETLDILARDTFAHINVGTKIVRFVR